MIEKSIELAKSIEVEQHQVFALAGIITFGDKVARLFEEEKQEAVTQVARLFEREKQEALRQLEEEKNKEMENLKKELMELKNLKL